MQLHLSSHLSWYLPQRLTRLEIHLGGPIALLELLAQLDLPPAEIAIAVVNGTRVSLQNTFICDADQVELHPAIEGG